MIENSIHLYWVILISLHLSLSISKYHTYDVNCLNEKDKMYFAEGDDGFTLSSGKCEKYPVNPVNPV